MLRLRLLRCFSGAAPPALHCVAVSPPSPSALPPVVFLHGLLGSSTNFRTVQQAVARHRPTLAYDLRNHGRSPHTRGAATLDDLAGDVGAALAELPGGARYTRVGHSLGGKVAMRLALARPELCHSLCVVDIAPAAYDTASEGWRAVQGVVRAASALDPSRHASRGEVDRALAALVPDPGVRSFVAQNLVPLPSGGFAWRLGWESILASMPHFAAWPSHAPAAPGLRAHFIRGTASTYISERNEGALRATFPGAQLHSVQAGHWVHAENPRDFMAVLRGVLELPAE